MFELATCLSLSRSDLTSNVDKPTYRLGSHRSQISPLNHICTKLVWLVVSQISEQDIQVQIVARRTKVNKENRPPPPAPTVSAPRHSGSDRDPILLRSGFKLPYQNRLSTLGHRGLALPKSEPSTYPPEKLRDQRLALQVDCCYEELATSCPCECS